VLDFIHDYLTDELSLVDLATQANLSAYHFARLFKQSIGLSPINMLQNRVERARG
jgi:AraC family transcriptional regulator